jgi:hypothetical protein
VSADACAVLGAALGIGGALVAAASRYWPRPRSPRADTAPGVLATGYRHCPAEQCTRAAVIRTDGTAACLDCGTPIPAPEATDA